MRPGARAAIWGASVAVIAAAIGGTGLYFYLSRTGTLSKIERPQSIVVVMVAPGEDGVSLAQGIAVLNVSRREWSYVDPNTTVTVSGTGYSRLRDALPFGGAAAVAEALSARQSIGRYAWVEIPYGAWTELLGGAGIQVVVPSAINVFDGERIVSFAEGTQTVPATDLAALLNGAAYLGAEERAELARHVALATVERLSQSAALPPGTRTDLAPDSVGLLRTAPTSQ